MKKKISILIFLFVFGIFFTSAIAQENTQVGDSEQFFENRPEVYVSDLKLDKTEYKAGDVVTGSVKVSNVKTSFVSNLNLKVSLVGGYKNSLYSVDYYNEKIDSISVKGKEAMLVSFSFALPVSSEAYSDEGQIGIKVKAFTDNGAPLGWDDTSIKIVGSSLPVVKANDAFVNVDGNNFTLQSGPTVYDGKKVSFNVSLFSSEDMVVSPDVVVYSMQNAKEPITSFKAKSISLKKQVKNTVSIDLPTFNNEKPGIYYGDIVFKDANNINRTSVFSFRYIIFGYVINVVNAITDKTSFDKGENINLSISYTGPAGDILELINDKETTDATSTKEVEKVDLTVKLFNEKQVLVAEYSGKADYISFASKNVLLTSTGKAKSTYTEVSFAKDGKVIGYYETKLSGDFDLIKYNLEKQQQILEVVILIVIIIIILLFVIFLKMKAKNKKGIILPMLVVLGLGFCFNNAFAWDEFHHSVYTDKFSSLMPSISLSSPSGLYGPGETITVSGTSYTLVCSNDDTFDVKYYVKGTTDLTSPNDYNCDDGPRCLESQSKMLKEFEDRFGEDYFEDEYALHMNGYTFKATETGDTDKETCDAVGDNCDEDMEFSFSYEIPSDITPGSTYRIYVRADGYYGDNSDVKSRVIGYQDIVVGTPSCNYIYGPWGACINGVQTRTVISALPVGCVGTPITSRSCTTPTIPTCTYSYGDWGVCVNGTRIRSETNNGPTGCTGGIRENTSTTEGCSAGGDTFIPQPTASLTASPSPIIISSKASTTLIWTSTNANSCSIAGPSVTWNNISPLNGNRITPVFTTTGPKVYTLTCYGADGVSTTSTATVQVSECPTNRQQEVCNYGLCQSEGKKYGPCETTCLDTGEKIPLLDRDGSDDCIFPTTIFIECSPEGNFIKDVQNNWLIQFPSGYNSPVITEINITHGQETVSGNKIMIPKIYTSTGEKTFEATITAIDKDSITYTGTCTATTTVSGGGGGTGQ